jgi:hypothetical protein
MAFDVRYGSSFAIQHIALAIVPSMPAQQMARIPGRRGSSRNPDEPVTRILQAMLLMALHNPIEFERG